MKNALTVAAKVAVSVAILYFIFSRIDIGSFWQTVSSVNPGLVLAIYIIFVAIQAFSAFRWSIVVKKDIEVPFPKILSIYFIGFFFNNFFPTLVGGDLVKGYYLYKTTGRGDVSFASIFMDRYSGFTALMAITLVALLLGYPLISDTGLPFFFILLIGGYSAASLVIWIDKLHGWAMRLLDKIHFYSINKKIDTFYKVLMSYRTRPDVLLKIFLCSLVVQGGIIVSYYLLGRGIGMNVPAGYYFLFIPLATAAAMIPVSLSGLGIREGAFVFLFEKAGATQEQALSLSLLFFVITVLSSVLGGIEYVRVGGRKEMGLPDNEGSIGYD